MAISVERMADFRNEHPEVEQGRSHSRQNNSSVDKQVNLLRYQLQPSATTMGSYLRTFYRGRPPGHGPSSDLHHARTHTLRSKLQPYARNITKAMAKGCPTASGCSRTR